MGSIETLSCLCAEGAVEVLKLSRVSAQRVLWGVLKLSRVSAQRVLWGVLKLSRVSAHRRCRGMPSAC